MKNIVFIMNPISGTVSKSAIPSMIEKLLDKELFSYDIRETQYAGHATEIAHQAIDEGVDIVCAIGGDGTVNEVGRALIGSQTALAIIPCGSGNGLARHLMLPMDAGKALKEGLKYEPETYEIEDETGKKRYKAFLISAANASQYGNNAYIAPQASMSDGKLDVIIMEPFDVLEAPQISIDMFNKTLDKNSKIKTFKTQHIHVSRKEPGLIHYDGDPVMTDADVDISIVSKGIKMVVNPHADKSHRQPNMVQTAFSEFFNDINAVRDNITKQGHRVQVLNKLLLRKLNL